MQGTAGLARKGWAVDVSAARVSLLECISRRSFSHQSLHSNCKLQEVQMREKLVNFRVKGMQEERLVDAFLSSTSISPLHER